MNFWFGFYLVAFVWYLLGVLRWTRLHRASKRCHAMADQRFRAMVSLSHEVPSLEAYDQMCSERTAFEANMDQWHATNQELTQCAQTQRLRAWVLLGAATVLVIRLIWKLVG
jgi:hypothetical protein